jgi:hypothetical protein
MCAAQNELAKLSTHLLFLMSVIHLPHPLFHTTNEKRHEENK